MNTSKDFQFVLNALQGAGKDFPRRYLRHFSDLGALELQTVLEVWPRVNLNRKLSLLEGLESLLEADTLVSFDDFARALLNDPDAPVRVHALRLLGECEDVKLIPTYIHLLKHDTDVNVRAEAARALNLFVDLGELEEIPEKAHRQVEDALLEAVDGEDDANVRRYALESLGFSSRPEVVELIESAFERKDPAWKVSALIAMGRSADDRWDDYVVSALLDENDDIRKAAVQSAGELSLKSARKILLQMLEEEENDEILSAAIWSLSQIGGEDVRTYLESMLDQTDDEDQMEFLEDALDNLAFTEDLARFDLMAFDPESVEDLIKEDEEDEDNGHNRK
ncbi:MAG TPA: HEAT repeat domain-containing protein [Anaerolineales bacterium]|nr:HEAT repeat domain-containing protein [Anaerolineales bacterium]